MFFVQNYFEASLLILRHYNRLIGPPEKFRVNLVSKLVSRCCRYDIQTKVEVLGGEVGRPVQFSLALTAKICSAHCMWLYTYTLPHKEIQCRNKFNNFIFRCGSSTFFVVMNMTFVKCKCCSYRNIKPHQ